ncbi:hypothetical protein [Candidatus Frankia nodulisporulans]|uniref:hypothetical protein n=1 Tax=Candidatus Frankia nodulisporulans TaxID=2060052 RepID=UPI0013D6AB77|nr:hypothetical protein [Candidatus Frankia nodulisporulans]
MSVHSRDLREVAVHEAGHVIVARALGATRAQARVTRAGGEYRLRFDGPDVADPAGDDAVIKLAGACAAGLIVGRDTGSGSDRAAARRLLRRSSRSLRDAQNDAARLVGQHRREIEALAARIAAAPGRWVA